MNNKERARKFNWIVLGWFKKHGRDLPWRRTKDPYRIFVSEVMLQQTQVERVLLKYREFLRKFPSARVLAQSVLGDVLRVWSGLGYNRRAKYLWECARMIDRRHGGKFPHEVAALRRLPGVGRSTAAALSAFAFGKDEPMIDTNVHRILCRVFFKKRVPIDTALYVFAHSIIPRGRGKEWNWALMDIGALFCKARGHRSECPLAAFHGAVNDFQYRKPQSRFMNSRRFWRGQVLALLAKTEKGYTPAALYKKLGILNGGNDLNKLNQKVFISVVRSLEREKLVTKNRQYVRLPQTLDISYRK